MICSRILILFASLLIASSVASPTASALSQEQRDIFDSGIKFFDTETADRTVCSEAAGGGGDNELEGLSTNVPAVWRNLILETAPTYSSVDPRIVASVLWAENRGWPEYKTSGWGVSSAGAKGPWQFIDSTWAIMGTDGDGDGSKDPENPKDAVHAAFKHNLESAGKPIATEGYTGDADADFETIIFRRNTGNLLGFAAKYNGSGAPDGVKLTDFPRNQNSDYVIMNYWLLATDFSKGWNPESDKFVDARSGQASDKSGRLDGSACPSGGGIVNTDGYSFPVGPQRKSQNGGVPGMSALPCSGTCHHDNTPAFDISRKPGGNSVTGTPIYAISDGKAVWVRSSYNGQAGCQSIQLVSKDGYWYWYGHIQQVSVNENEPVTAGQQIAVIGERRCTDDGKGTLTDPHLHIDRGSPKGNEGGGKCCRDPGIVPIINSLFESLPE